MSATDSHYIDAVLHSYKSEFMVRGDVHNSILKHYEDDVVISGHKPMRNVTMPDGVTVVSTYVRANYGIIQVMQSCFLASLRMSCSSRSVGPHSLMPNNRSSQGGSKSLGEMECMQLVASGMSGCIQ